ncbi:hypothetical protein GCM10008992_09670 [Halorubrum aquaticum]
MQTQHGGIRIGIGREPRKIESIGSVTDALVERLELVALERPCLVHVTVEKFDDDSVFLYVGDLETILREWCEQSRIRGETLALVEERVPCDAERHYRVYRRETGKA